MNKFKHFLGIDVSKDYFDAVVLVAGKKENAIHNQFSNDLKGIKSLVVWLKGQDADFENTLVCLEHTGMYGKLIVKYLTVYKFTIWVEISLKIIRSIGVQRGKNDKLDAERIAYYAMKNVDEAQIFTTPRKEIEKIRNLLSLREKLVETQTHLKRNAKELSQFDKEVAKFSATLQKNTLKGIALDLKSIEKQLDTIIKEDENLSRIFKLTTSVIGVGKVTALFLICFTNEFTMYATPRQLACYTGVVPFEYTSGKSVRAKPKVHYMANKKLKKQLHMCALSAITSDPELKHYFERKVGEGKSKMLVINNIRNKIVHRICACIRNNKAFEKRQVA
ncbi:IS110 family transposase [Flavobacterium sp.]|uniref:IS110 family transposase n=1 Tax=Flavobacterium sp. TaxID=239 RepID=UPI00260EA8EC|nr:IS110 family transposase [Flavobacterium sp.]